MEPERGADEGGVRDQRVREIWGVGGGIVMGVREIDGEIVIR
jgi:hypothetical protein